MREPQPKYKIGQTVVVQLSFENLDKYRQPRFAIKSPVEGKISVISAAGTSEIDTYKYGITTDMPGCYHTGQLPFVTVFEKDIVLKEEDIDDRPSVEEMNNS